MVAAQRQGEILAPLEYEGTMGSHLFEYWFEHILLPELPRKTVIVMDNASFHRKNALCQIAESFDCSLLFLPPYSPDLNPIEHFWAGSNKNCEICCPLMMILTPLYQPVLTSGDYS